MSSEQGRARDIDWETAEVQDGTLAVGLTGESDDEWSDGVRRVLDRLGTRGVDDVEVEDDRLVVRGVRAGAERDVHHLLESAVMQANANVAPEDDDDRGGERSKEDRGMTDAFRSFAQRRDDEDR
jgi:hypothetical protein